MSKDKRIFENWIEVTQAQNGLHCASLPNGAQIRLNEQGGVDCYNNIPPEMVSKMTALLAAVKNLKPDDFGCQKLLVARVWTTSVWVYPFASFNSQKPCYLEYQICKNYLGNYEAHLVAVHGTPVPRYQEEAAGKFIDALKVALPF